MKKYINVIKPVIFCIICLLVFELISPVFRVQDYRCKQTSEGFYSEAPGSLDAVFIGASSTYAAWQPPFIYDEFGFTSYTLALPHMPKALILPFIEEARKTQPDALYIIALNGFSDREMNHDHFHHSLDYLKFSRNKVNMVNVLRDFYGQTPDERLELLVPFYRFHSAWDDLKSETYAYELEDYKNGQTFDNFLNEYTDQHHNYAYTTEKEAVKAEDKTLLDEIMAYSESNNVRVVFVTLPQALTVESQIARLNGVADYVRGSGYDVIDLMPEFDTCNLDLSHDFYNRKHTNLHGSIKVMRYLGSQLKELFDLPDKHSAEVDADWEEATAAYMKDYMNFRVAGFEWDNAPRDISLASPVLLSLVPQEYGYTLDWEPVDGADGYEVYRKYNGGKGWEQIADLTDDFLDDHIKDINYKKYYFYSVIAYRMEDGTKVYGQYDHKGLNCKAWHDPGDSASEEVIVDDEEDL